MYDDDMYGGLDGDTPEPPPTKTIGQSILAIGIVLAIGGGAVSLMLIHSVAEFVGFFLWTAVTLVPGFGAAYQMNKHLMTGYHNLTRLIVGVIVFFSVAVFIAAGLNAYHYGSYNN